MLVSLEDAGTIVTGATSGNGRAIALKLAEVGANVTIADIREEPREGGQPTHELIETDYDTSARFVENRCNLDR